MNLDYPPGNVAVSPDGRLFFTLHPDGDPPIKVAELVDGKPVPYPNGPSRRADGDKPHFQSPLALRIDRQNRLWVLDYADYGARPAAADRLRPRDGSSSTCTTSRRR